MKKIILINNDKTCSIVSLNENSRIRKKIKNPKYSVDKNGKKILKEDGVYEIESDDSFYKRMANIIADKKKYIILDENDVPYQGIYPLIYKDGKIKINRDLILKQKITLIKEKASALIEDIAPQYKQINYLAEAQQIILNMFIENKFNDERLAFLIGIKEKIQKIRDKTNKAESYIKNLNDKDLISFDPLNFMNFNYE